MSVLSNRLKKRDSNPVYLAEITAADWIRNWQTLTLSPPAAPTSPSAVRDSGAFAIDLAWTASAGATSYSVYRSTVSGSGYTLIGTTGSTSYVDSTGTRGTTYYYVITASNGAGASGNSSEVNAKLWNIFDLFTRANSNTSVGTAPSGQVWNAFHNTSGIFSNEWYGSAIGTDYDASSIDAGASDGTYTVKLDSGNADLSLETMRIYFRITDYSNFWMVQMGNGGALYLFSCAAGVFTNHGTYSGTISKGDQIDIVMSGNTYTIKQNGTTRLTYTDGTNYLISNTLMGIGTYMAGTQNGRYSRCTFV